MTSEKKERIDNLHTEFWWSRSCPLMSTSTKIVIVTSPKNDIQLHFPEYECYSMSRVNDFGHYKKGTKIVAQLGAPKRVLLQLLR